MTSAYHFEGDTISRTRKRFTPFVKPLGLCVLFLTACPQTNPTPPTIAEVAVEAPGSEYTNSFSLKVGGRGFGLSRVRYSQKEGTGVADSPDLGFRLLKEGSPFGPSFDRDALDVVSSQLLVLRVTLSSPLEVGRYGIEIHEGDQVIAEEPDAFQIDGDPPPFDAGPTDTGNPPPDGGPGDADAGFPDVPAGIDTGMPDTGFDAGQPDLGPPDLGIMFPGSFTRRQEVILNNAATVPADVTIRVTVPHQQLVMLQLSRPDGLDLVVYQGQDPLPRHFADRVAVGSNGLELIFRLLRDVPVGSSDLYLYYGDPTAMVPLDETVFEFVERFAAALPNNTGNDAAWTVADDWARCDVERPDTVAGPVLGTYCYDDNADGNIFRTLASPRVTGAVSNPGPETDFEFQMFFLNGAAAAGDDGFYLAYHDENGDFANTTLFPDTGYRGFPTNTTANIDGRMIPAWLDNSAANAWQRIAIRWIPTIDRPSIHMRHLSNDDTNQVVVAVDDWWVRKSWTGDDNNAVTLGPSEGQ